MTGRSPVNLYQLCDPRYILQVDGFLDAETCRALCEYAKTQNPAPLGVVDGDKSTDHKIVSKVDKETRDTYAIPIQGIEDRLRSIFYRVVTEQIEPFYAIEMEWWEKPQFLYYQKGGKYKPHVDSDRWQPRPGGGGAWVRDLDRDISVLIYLNDAFTGGGLHFPSYDLTITPKPGLLVAFPSHSGYKHGAEETLSGERYVLVSWMARRGMAKLRPPAYGTIFKDAFC
jgi:hypothetical protein